MKHDRSHRFAVLVSTDGTRRDVGVYVRLRAISVDDPGGNHYEGDKHRWNDWYSPRLKMLANLDEAEAIDIERRLQFQHAVGFVVFCTHDAWQQMAVRRVDSVQEKMRLS
jgi:hypothetical protein